MGCPVYDSTVSDNEASALDIFGLEENYHFFIILLVKVGDHFNVIYFLFVTLFVPEWILCLIWDKYVSYYYDMFDMFHIMFHIIMICLIWYVWYEINMFHIIMICLICFILSCFILLGYVWYDMFDMRLICFILLWYVWYVSYYYVSYY